MPKPQIAPTLLLAVAVAVALTAGPAAAHVTPNVQLLKRGDFVKQNLPDAARFSEPRLVFAKADVEAIKSRTHWTPSEEDVKVYLGRDAQGRLAGSALFVWVPSEHGPVGVAVAFDTAGRIRQAAVTDVGSEPLAWVRPLLDANGMAVFAGLTLDADPDPGKVAPGVTGKMSRYYAEVIANGISRTQAVERIALAAATRQ
jgi:hypothetical protein